MAQNRLERIPMKIYVQIGDDGTVTAFSTCSTADVQVEAEVTGPLYPAGRLLH